MTPEACDAMEKELDKALYGHKPFDWRMHIATGFKAACAIDVDPVLAEQATEIERLKSQLETYRTEFRNQEDKSRRIATLEAEKKYWNCKTHGETQNAWGCPECVRELRQENHLLKSNLVNAEAQWKRVIEERDELESKFGKFKDSGY